MNKKKFIKKILIGALALSFLPNFLEAREFNGKTRWERRQKHRLPKTVELVDSRVIKPQASEGPKDVATLLIGINYEGTGSELSNCIKDIDHVWKNLLTAKMQANLQNLIYMSDKMSGTSLYPTKANILEQFSRFANLVNQTKKGYFHYSGHGTRVKDTSKDEKDGYDEALVPIDYERAGFVIDDDAYKNLVKKFSPDAEVFITSDCCHSGTIMDLPYKWDGKGKKTTENTLLQTEVNQLAKVVMLSGCTDSQTSADGGPITVDGEGSGALTGAFLAVLKKYNYVLTYRQLLVEINKLLIRNGFSQRPELSSTKNLNLDEVVSFSVRELALSVK